MKKIGDKKIFLTLPSVRLLENWKGKEFSQFFFQSLKFLRQMNRENVRFYIGSLPDLVDALDVEDNAHEVLDVAPEVENDASDVVDDDQEVVPDVQEVVIDV